MEDSNVPTTISDEELADDFDVFQLNRELDITKSEVFMHSYSSFLVPLMCSMNFVWARDIPTAATNGITIWWNPWWFKALPEKTRVTVLLHELYHPSRLHFLRMEDRDPLKWNWACDLAINGDLRRDGRSFTGTRPWLSDEFKGWAEEQIYDHLLSLENPGSNPWSDDMLTDLNGGDDDFPDVPTGDMIPMTEDDIRKAVNNVIQADETSKMTGGKGIGEISGDAAHVLKQYLTPVVPWEKELADFMNDLSGKIFTYRRPNRRHRDIYLPSRMEDRGALEDLYYYWDVSGSISEKDEIRFNSEVRHIKEIFRPKNLTLVQFDTQIKSEQTFEAHEEFEDIRIIGKGGTCLNCVHNHINEHEPTAAIIFTDLYCAPMPKLKHDIPILWVVVNNPTASVPFGKMTHIRS